VGLRGKRDDPRGGVMQIERKFESKNTDPPINSENYKGVIGELIQIIIGDCDINRFSVNISQFTHNKIVYHFTIFFLMSKGQGFVPFSGGDASGT
jgi:hypothetical protein